MSEPSEPSEPPGSPGVEDLLPVRWSILGPLVGRRDGEALDLGPPTRRSLLALLLAHAGDPVSMSTVVDTLWGTDPPDRAVNIVHRHVGALRRLVQPDLARRAQGRWLLSTSTGYRVVVEERDLDLLESRGLAARARAIADPGRRLDLLRRALDLWHGAAAEDVEPDVRRDPVFAALDREQAELAVEAARPALAQGRADLVLPALQHAARVNPVDELVHAQLLRALASTGRRAQALDTYGRVRTYLVEQLGISPGPALESAHLDVLRDETPATGVPGLPRPAELPADPALFVARETELARLREVAAAAEGSRPPIVITGTAGVGKTSLATRFAHEIAGEYPDGQLYVDLLGFGPDRRAPVPTGDVLTRFLEALDVPRAKIPSDLDARAALYRSALASRRLLIVLDNARDTAHVRPLLPGSPGCQVVVTSRSQLRGLVREGASWVPLRLLDAADARAYVTRRVGADRVAAEPDAVDALYAMSDGLPIALALLTARLGHTPHASLGAVVEEVGRSRGTLVPFVDSADPTTDLRAVFSWSYDALTPAAARLFRLLALHPPPSVPVAVAAVLAGTSEAEARSLLEEMAEASLATEPAPGRYARHDLLERYATELLAGDRSEAAAEDRMYAYYTRLAGAACRTVSPGRVGLPDLYLKSEDGDGDSVAEGPADEDAAAAWFEREHRVLAALMLRAGKDGDLDPYVWRLAWATWQHLDRRGRWEELLLTQEAGLAAARRSARPEVEAAMRPGLARGCVRAGRLDTAEQHVRDALRVLAGADAGKLFTAEVHRSLAWIHEKQGRIEDALEQTRYALALHDPDSRTSARANALNGVGWFEACLGQYDSALEHCHASIALHEELGERGGLGDAWSSLAYVHEQQGRIAAAVGGYRRSLLYYRSGGYRFPAATVTMELGRTLVEAGHPGPARALFTAAVQAYDELGHERADVARGLLADLDAAAEQPADNPAS